MAKGMSREMIFIVLSLIAVGAVAVVAFISVDSNKGSFEEAKEGFSGLIDRFNNTDEEEREVVEPAVQSICIDVPDVEDAESDERILLGIEDANGDRITNYMIADGIGKGTSCFDTDLSNQGPRDFDFSEAETFILYLHSAQYTGNALYVDNWRILNGEEIITESDYPEYQCISIDTSDCEGFRKRSLELTR